MVIDDTEKTVIIRQKIQDLIWTELFEEVSWAKSDILKALSCGCLVTLDHGYLDAYIWTGSLGFCNDTSNHYLVELTRDSTEPLDAKMAAHIRTMISRYTTHWSEADDVLAKFDKIVGEL